MNHEKTTETIDISYGTLLESEPKLITNFVPSNAAEQREAFLRGDIRNPNHTYGKLDTINFGDTAEAITKTGETILGNPDLNPKHAAAYEQFVAGYLKKTRLLELVHVIKTTSDPAEKEAAKREYMALNIELYGEPDETTYRSLLQEKLRKIAGKNLTGQAAVLRQELFDSIGYDDSVEVPERFKPSTETVEWMHEVVETLYGNMLAHVPEDKETFTVVEAQQVFQEIIDEEFEGAGEGWVVDVEDAKSINVKAAEKRIVIPTDRGDLSRDVLRKLIVHELGVHMLRAITGADTDLHPLGHGLDNYYDAEEGLGVVMEQALQGQFKEAGIDHYITAGLAYHDKKDFRGIYEAKWRLSVLGSLDDNGEVSESAVQKAQKAAYGGTMRSLRGTDELPWFKDLAYYNGAVDMWRHLESIRGDDLKFMFVLMGKGNPADIDHERIMYETSTV
ncbi:MAG: DUF1704 domain-containing protein [Candidatus Saccharibacteria bacterium]|nr:MAG: DUF1704 domain-containing protein [Candidatus Saccharibacteria bacterium]